MKKLSQLIREGAAIAEQQGVKQAFGGMYMIDDFYGVGTKCACAIGMAKWALHPEKTWDDLAQYEARSEGTYIYPNNIEELAVPHDVLEATGLDEEQQTIKGCNPALWAILQNDDANVPVLEIAEALEKEGF